MLFKCFNAFEYDFHEMKTFFAQNKMPVTLFDFDFINRDDPMYDKNMLLVMLSLTNNSTSSEKIKQYNQDKYAAIFNKMPKWREIWQQHEPFLRQLVNKLDRTMSVITGSTQLSSEAVNLPANGRLERFMNTLQNETEEIIGSGFHPVRNLFRKSCDPNILMISVNNKKAFVIAKPTLAGSEVFSSGAGSFYITELAQRQYISQSVGKKCKCEACRLNWPTLDGLKAIDSSFKDPRTCGVSSKAKIKENIKKGVEYVEKNYRPGMPVKEVYCYIKMINYWMHLLATSPLYPQIGSALK